MTMLQADGFDHYGTYDGSSGPGVTNMLAGTYAQADSTVILGVPSWGARTGAVCVGNEVGAVGIRRVLAATKTVLFVGFGYSTTSLPNRNGAMFPISFREGANKTVGGLCVESTGAISVRKSSDTGANGQLDTVIATTAGPVVVAENWHYFEMKMDQAGSTFELRVDGNVVLNVNSITWSNTAAIAQYACLGSTSGAGFNAPVHWMDDLTVCDTVGAINTTFSGDKRVATLFPNSNGAAQGWTPRYRHLFGNGILDNRASNESGVTCAASTQTDLGSGDFTLEGWYRTFALPTGNNKAVLFGKWDETNNRRSYQLYQGGNTLESGNLVFRISTDGAAGTVTELISWPYIPALDVWNHYAIVRISGALMLFVNGVQLGVPTADANTYYAGAEPACIGGQAEGTSNMIANCSFNGFQDEFRLTVGVGRYSSNFTPTGPFPRNVGGDPSFASVAWLSGWDSGVFDESSFARTLTAQQGAIAITPDDGSFAYQAINNQVPRDDTFIEAALTAATGVLTMTGVGTAAKIVTVGTTDGSTPAVYTLRAAVSTAFDVKIGATAAATLQNLVNAINAGAGAGTLYGTGTTANFDVSAVLLPGTQLQVTALTAGTAGNSIASTTNETTASWAHATLTGGAAIPSYSEFGFQRLPQGTTVVRSATIVHRDFKSDSGTCAVQASLIGPLGGVETGANNSVTVSPTYYQDIFETDADTSAALTPTSITSGRVRVNRTA